MSEAEREERPFLGLTHNPFIEPHRGFFERGGRKTHLEQLRHLSEWSRRVLLVTGPDGVGKTVLYRELAATLEPRVKAARINASLVNTGFEVLSAIAQGFGLAIPADANTQSLRLDLIEHVERQSEGDRLCLTLVDDAHLLDNKAVDSLIALTHESAMHLVLFGEVRMVPVVERTASAKGVGWQEIRLNGYGQADARDYLEWRFQQARYRGRVPFTDNEVRDLIRLSEGLPGRINQMANVLLVKLESGEGQDLKRGFPRLHVAMLALLVVLIGLLYIISGEEAPERRAGQLASADPILVPEARDADAADEPSQSPTEDSGEFRPEEAGSDDVAVDEPGIDEPGIDEPGIEEPGIEEPGIAEPGKEGTDDAGGDDGVRTEPVNEATANEATAPVQDETDEAAAEPVPPVENTTPTTAGVSPAARPVERPEAEAESNPVAASTIVGVPAGTKDTNWLLKQDENYFTLQLVTVSTPERAAAFVSRQREPAEFAIYQLQRDGRILHVVLYGLFSSRDAAQAAADNLPGEVGSVQPWIRPVGQVQAAARVATFQ